MLLPGAERRPIACAVPPRSDNDHIFLQEPNRESPEKRTVRVNASKSLQLDNEGATDLMPDNNMRRALLKDHARRARPNRLLQDALCEDRRTAGRPRSRRASLKRLGLTRANAALKRRPCKTSLTPLPSARGKSRQAEADVRYDLTEAQGADTCGPSDQPETSRLQQR